MKKIKIWHLATHTTNIGDGALTKGIQENIKNIFKNNKIHIYEDCLMYYKKFWGKKEFNNRTISKINKFDCLIIGGGGMIEGKKNNIENGMAIPITLEQLKKIQIPIIFYGIGYNQYSNEKFYNLDMFKKFLEYIKKQRNILFSLRNDGSFQRLKVIMNENINFIKVIPDPGYFLKLNNKQKNHKKYILLQLAGDNLKYRFKKNIFFHKEKINNFLNELSIFIKKICQNKNINIFFCPHLIKDIKIFDLLIQKLDQGTIRKFIEMTPVLNGNKNVNNFFNYYQMSSVVVGMRGHSIICSTGLKKPTIAISNHPKVVDYMKLHGLDNYCISSQDGLGEKLYQKVIYCLNNEKKLKKKYDNIYKQNTKINLKFNKDIVRLLRNNF